VALDSSAQDEVIVKLTAQLDIDEPENEDLGYLRGALVDELVQLSLFRVTHPATRL
jgi:hypothetical protein